MAIRIECSACNTVMRVAEELDGKRVRCKACGNPVTVEASIAQTEIRPARSGDWNARPASPPSRPIGDDRTTRRAESGRRRDDYDDDGDFAEGRQRSSSGSLLPLWLGGGVAAGVLLAVVLVFALRSASEPDVPAPQDRDVVLANNVQPPVNDNPAAPAGQPPAGQPGAAEKANNPPQAAANPVAPAKRIEPLPDLPPGQVLSGEQIYQRLLHSTVWIVASHHIAAVGDNRPFAQEIPQPPGLPGIPRPPGLAQIKKKTPFGPGSKLIPPLPNGDQQSTLRSSVWDGSETLPGYGKLRFQFISNLTVIMVDARDTSRGTFAHVGNSVTLRFGEAVYTGTVNGDSMSGNASNGQVNWTWNVSRGAANTAPANPGNARPGSGIVAKSTGSGSLIDAKHRLVVTNVHVVGNSETVTIYFPEFDGQGELIVRSDAYKQKPGITGRVVAKEERADLALVQLERLPEGVAPLPVASTKAKPAQQVHSVGNPGASKGLWIYSPGKVRQVFQDQWKIRDDLSGKVFNYDAMKLETDSAINPGDSGGPLVDDRCRLIGVAHGQNLVANNFSFFIEAAEVRQLLDRYLKSVNDRP